MMEQLKIHIPGCMCVECQAWFSAMTEGKVTGLCRCNKPIDDHPKDKRGQVQSCG